jgi:hypothetical protein
MLQLMVVAYFSNKNNIVSRLGYSRVRNGYEEAQIIGFDSCFDQLLKGGLRLVL